MAYTLGQAAKATGLSKPTIANAIKRGRISAQKDQITGQFSIDPAELHRVFPVASHAEKMGGKANESSLEKTNELIGLRVKVEVLEKLLKELERSRDKAEAESEAWKEEAAHLRKLLPAPVITPAPAKTEAAPTSNAAPESKERRGIFGWLKARPAA